MKLMTHDEGWVLLICIGTAHTKKLRLSTLLSIFTKKFCFVFNFIFNLSLHFKLHLKLIHAR